MALNVFGRLFLSQSEKCGTETVNEIKLQQNYNTKNLKLKLNTCKQK